MGRKERQRVEQLALANALSRIVLSGSDITEIGRGFAFELTELMSISWAAIALIEESKGRLRLFPLLPKLSSGWELGDSIPLDDTPIAWLAENKKALLESDLRKESRFWTGAHWLKQGLRTVAYMPLFSGGEVFGGLVFASTRPGAYGERELKLLKYAAGEIAAPIRHSKEFASVIEEKQATGPPPEEWMSRIEQALQSMSSAIAEFAAHLQSHTSAIQGLNDASQELKKSAAEQNRILTQIAKAMEQPPPRREPKVRKVAVRETGRPVAPHTVEIPPETEQVVVEVQVTPQIQPLSLRQPATPPVSRAGAPAAEEETTRQPVDIRLPGCYRRRGEPARQESLAEKQRRLLEKRAASKGLLCQLGAGVSHI